MDVNRYKTVIAIAICSEVLQLPPHEALLKDCGVVNSAHLFQSALGNLHAIGAERNLNSKFVCLKPNEIRVSTTNLDPICYFNVCPTPLKSLVYLLASMESREIIQLPSIKIDEK